MLKRIFITIKRGMTDNTAVCVFPWEKPLIEEIHGGNAQVITIDEMCSRDGVKSVKKIKINQRQDLDGKLCDVDEAPDLRAQLEQMTEVDPENNPMDDPEQEFGRMVEKYGMHPKIELPVVEKVFGNSRVFRQCMRDFAAGRVPEFLNDGSDDEHAETPIAEMTAEQLREMLTKLGVKYPPKASRTKLEEIAVEAAAEAPA